MVYVINTFNMIEEKEETFRLGQRKLSPESVCDRRPSRWQWFRERSSKWLDVEL